MYVFIDDGVLNIQTSFLLAVFLSLFIVGCDGGPGPNPPPDKGGQADSISIAAEAVSGGSIVETAGIWFDPPNADPYKAGTGSVDTTVATQSEPAAMLVLATDKEHVPSDTAVVDLNRNRGYDLTLRMKKLPEEVTLEFSSTAADADSSVYGTWTWNGEEIASGVSSGGFTVPGSNEAGTLCFEESEFFKERCQEVTPNEETVSTALDVQRKQVTVASTPEDSTGAVIPDAVTFVGPDSVEIEGDGSIKRPKRAGTRTLVGDWITEEPNSRKLDRYRSETVTVSAAEDIDAEIVIDQLIPACSDGIDNDGDGFADKAETRACTNLDGEYDPQDDNEILKGFRRGTLRVFNDSTFVSRKAGERTAEIWPASDPLPWSVTVAKGEIGHRIEVQRSDSISHQSHATHLKTGRSNDNLTVENTSKVTADADTANGFVLIRVHGIDRSFFADGPHYAVYGWHGCKVKNNCGSIEGSGKFYYYAELQNGRAHSWSYVYEPEDVPENKQKSVFQQAQSTTLKSGQCRQVSKTDEVCRVPAEQTRGF
jgi:hypothetical protein